MADIILEKIEAALSAALPETDCRENNVTRAMRYSLLGGGKRLRAQLVLLFCEACGGNAESAIPFACAVEMVHAYSLIHDDLPCMDDDELRRGKPSCHIAFDYATALLAGDALQAKAFEFVSQAKLPAESIVQGMRILAECIGEHGMVGGQIIDMEYEDKPCNRDVLEDIESKKTGALIKAACLLGCVAAGADEKQKKAAEKYASAFGSAFQITDDILDVTSTTDRLGKPTGSDERQKKSTFVSVLGLEEARKTAKVFTNEAISATIIFHDKGEKLRNIAQKAEKRMN